jgi:hypothetical protein
MIDESTATFQSSSPAASASASSWLSNRSHVPSTANR